MCCWNNFRVTPHQFNKSVEAFRRMGPPLIISLPHVYPAVMNVLRDYLTRHFSFGLRCLSMPKHLIHISFILIKCGRGTIPSGWKSYIIGQGVSFRLILFCCTSIMFESMVAHSHTMFTAILQHPNVLCEKDLHLKAFHKEIYKASICDYLV